MIIKSLSQIDEQIQNGQQFEIEISPGIGCSNRWIDIDIESQFYSDVRRAIKDKRLRVKQVRN